ncbi:MAG TPA: rhodanese-like domain-containing protein [Candidatus Acidoferrales bacterium]|nr:rhodanese-like domain-containing protein [Candidatus Acidoferrales bacterium]
MPEREPVVELLAASELGNTSFLVADPDAGEAVAVDPFRDVAQYLEKADGLGTRITASLETHVHNDFVSGARELEKEAGAAIWAAADAGLQFPHQGLRPKSEVAVGRFRLEARHTPGHTPQHLSFLLRSESGRPLAIFSGGALMVGAIARTDLFGPHLATHLALDAFKTLHVRLRELPDEVAVYPTHGGGSFCAAGPGGRQSTTMGRERETNPFLLTTELMPFIARTLHTGAYPAYYRRMGELNRRGAPLLGRDLPPLKALDAGRVAELKEAGSAVIDVRSGRDFDRGHLPGSFCVGLEGPFSAWVGWIVSRERSIVLTGGTPGQLQLAQRQLLRIGYDGVEGYLEGGLEAWQESGRPVTTFETAEIDDLATWILSAEPVTVVDARNEDEWVHGHVPGALHIPVPEIRHHVDELPLDAPVAVHCGVGYRAAIAASLLEQAGVRRIIHVVGKYSDWDRMHLAATIPG